MTAETLGAVERRRHRRSAVALEGHVRVHEVGQPVRCGAILLALRDVRADARRRHRRLQPSDAAVVRLRLRRSPRGASFPRHGDITGRRPDAVHPPVPQAHPVGSDQLRTLAARDGSAGSHAVAIGREQSLHPQTDRALRTVGPRDRGRTAGRAAPVGRRRHRRRVHQQTADPGHRRSARPPEGAARLAPADVSRDRRDPRPDVDVRPGRAEHAIRRTRRLLPRS